MPLSQIEFLLSRLREKKKVKLAFAPGSSASWLIGLIQRKINRPILVLTETPEKASEISEELKTFCPSPPALFPGLDYYQPEGTEPSGERAGALAQILTGQIQLLVAPAISVFQPTLAKNLLLQYLFELKPGANLEPEQFLARLSEAGYEFAETVSEPKQISRRGGIIDLFPPASQFPVRMEFFGDRIESLRAFDPVSQVSKQKLGRALIWPATELILTGERAQELKKALFKLAEDLKKSQLEKNISYTRPVQEIVNQLDNQSHFYAEERFLALLENAETLLDYLTDEWLVVTLDPLPVNQSLSKISLKAREDWARLVSGGSLLPKPGRIFFASEPVNEKFSRFQSITLGGWVSGKEEPAPSGELELHLEPGQGQPIELVIEINPDLGFSPKLPEPVSKLLTEIKRLKSEKFSAILVCSTLSQGERLADLFREQEIFPAELESKDEFFEPKWPLTIAIGELAGGFRIPEFGLAIISEQEIFGEKIRRRLIPAERVEWKEEDLSDLEPGEPVVHLQHGIGLYQGMCRVKVASFEKWDVLKDRERPMMLQPCLEIEYADNAKLFLPVDRIHQIQKYRSPGEAPPKLDRLGTRSFELAKKRAMEAIEKLAEDLLELYAAREVFPGHAFPEPDHTYREFEAGFEYEETPDQENTIETVIEDLSRDRPMDRLVLGDVGYGKTEVALRAAFLVAMEARQAALLCPTTILAQQHFDTFQRRLKEWPLEVCMLSRFQSRISQKKILAQLKNGNCDIVIGTHRLLSKDVEFLDLGLLIIDEEQRFGVVQKEKIKKLKKTVHCLTLSATPIPRTMEMSLLGLRDLSTINTPPPDRQAIHTELIHFDQQLIREAILREMQRNGQVFFVHNRVQGIDQLARWISKLVPEAKIAVAHGQMDEKKLEQVMHGFYQHKYDVLVSTVIIESGLDLPSANTIIINRADQFGLAQLYQLRGRIGRSKEKGYAYLVVPSRAALKGDAVKRLKALKEFTELGSGFKLAAYDLKIRGAGNLLGREQSGQINRIGYELYLRLLEQKINALKGIKVEEEFEPRIKLAIPAFLAEDYIPGDSERLGWYKRLAMAQDQAQLNSLREELMDRYGKLPSEAATLLEVVRLKFQLKQSRIPELEADETRALITFNDQSRIDLDRLIQLAHHQPSSFKFTKDQKFLFLFQEKSPIFPQLQSLFQKIRAAP